MAFGVCLNSVTRDGPLVQTVLYLHDALMRLYLNIFRREPAISRFDWNFTATHLIRSLFNVSRFGPPSSVTWTSAWTWVDHLVSGLQSHTKTPISDSLSLRLRIRCLTLHVITTRRFILQKARHHPLTGSDYL